MEDINKIDEQSEDEFNDDNDVQEINKLEIDESGAKEGSDMLNSDKLEADSSYEAEDMPNNNNNDSNFEDNSVELNALLKQDNKKWVYLIILLPIVFFSILGFRMWQNITPDNGAIFVNGYEFGITGETTFTSYINQGGEQTLIGFNLDPREANKFSFDPNITKTIFGAKQIYITFDPEFSEKAQLAIAAAQISRITDYLYGIETKGAVTNPIYESQYPIKTCNDATARDVIISLELGEQDGAELEGNCVRVIGTSGKRIALAADKLGFNLVGISI